jgi:hypothetical protein
MDVFEGFNYPHAMSSSDVFWAGTHQTDRFEAVRERIQAYGRGVESMRIEVSKCNIITDPIVRSYGGMIFSTSCLRFGV